MSSKRRNEELNFLFRYYEILQDRRKILTNARDNSIQLLILLASALGISSIFKFMGGSTQGSSGSAQDSDWVQLAVFFSALALFSVVGLLTLLSYGHWDRFYQNLSVEVEKELSDKGLKFLWQDILLDRFERGAPTASMIRAVVLAFFMLATFAYSTWWVVYHLLLHEQWPWLVLASLAALALLIWMLVAYCRYFCLYRTVLPARFEGEPEWIDQTLDCTIQNGAEPKDYPKYIPKAEIQEKSCRFLMGRLRSLSMLSFCFLAISFALGFILVSAFVSHSSK